MPELTITASSLRYYEDEIEKTNGNEGILRSMALTFFRYNIMMEWLYNRKYDAKYCGAEYSKTYTAMAKEEYARRFGGKLSDYYITSIDSKANAVLASQRELQKLYEREYKERTENREEKIKNLEDELEDLSAVKGLLAERSRALKEGRAFNNSRFKKYGLSASADGICFRGKANKMVLLPYYAYECMLDNKIGAKKHAAKMIGGKIKRAEQMHSDIPKRATFGTRQHYRHKDTKHLTGKERKGWHRQRVLSRFGSITLNGRHTSQYGNFQCRYDPEAKKAEITLIDGKVLTMTGLEFPYRGDELIARRMEKDHPSVSYSLEYKKDGHGKGYFILKAHFKISNDHVNLCTDDGIVAFDLNYGHIAWADLNKDGCLLDCGVIPFSLEGLNSAEAKSVLGNACKKAVGIAAARKKPIGMEDLDIKKTKLEYGSAKANRKISGFACATMTGLIEGQALRQGVGIIKVNPAYTSFFGKTKYMKPYGISIHCAAAYAIGRRALGYTERLPANLRHVYFSRKKDGTVKNNGKALLPACRLLYKHIRQSPASFWYRDVKFKTWKDFDSQVKAFKTDVLGA